MCQLGQGRLVSHPLNDYRQYAKQRSCPYCRPYTSNIRGPETWSSIYKGEVALVEPHNGSSSHFSLKLAGVSSGSEIRSNGE